MAFPNDLMFDTVYVQPCVGESGYGPIFGVEFEELCSLEPGFKSVTDAKGNVVVASLSGIFRAECAIKVNDEISYETKRFRAVNVALMRLEGIGHHVEIDFASVAG